jgi:ribonuclease HI
LTAIIHTRNNTRIHQTHLTPHSHSPPTNSTPRGTPKASSTRTDHKKEGNPKLGASIVNPETGITIHIEIKSQEERHTINRAELSAITLTLELYKEAPTLQILTDSAFSINTLRNYALNPLRYTHHTHIDLLAHTNNIVNERDAKGYTTHTNKVKSHTGVQYNDASDAGACGVVDRKATKTIYSNIPKQAMDNGADHSIHAYSTSPFKARRDALEVAWGVHVHRCRRKTGPTSICSKCQSPLSNTHLLGGCSHTAKLRTKRHNSTFLLLQQLLQTSNGGRWLVIGVDLGKQPVTDFRKHIPYIHRRHEPLQPPPHHAP